MNREQDNVPPGLTVQRVTPLEALQAQLIGTLEIDTVANCLVVRTGDSVVDVAWPLGWSVDGELALVDAAGRTVGRLGDEVAVGGGFVDVAVADVVSCAGHRWVFMASGLSRG